MNSLTEVVPVGSTVSRGTISNRFFKICYLTAITVSTIGWVSAFRLGHCQVGKVVYGLDQILGYPAADHDPESKIYFQRDPHRASPHF